MQGLFYKMKNPKLRFWAIITILFFTGIMGLGAVFQGNNSDTWFSMPSLWFFSLIVLPLLLYLLIRIYWAKEDRFR